MEIYFGNSVKVHSIKIYDHVYKESRATCLKSDVQNNIT